MPVPRPRGRASRSDSGSWRRGSAEDEREEHGGISEEEIEVKSRAPSLARSTRGRRLKTGPSPAAVPEGPDEKVVGETRTERVVKPAWTLSDVQTLSSGFLGAASIALLVLVVLLSLNAPSLEAGSSSTPYHDAFRAWLKNKLPRVLLPDEWKAELEAELTADTKVEILTSIESVTDAPSARPGSHCECNCPPIPMCDSTIACTAAQTITVENARETAAIPTLLPASWVDGFPTVANAANDAYGFSFQAVAERPWVFELLCLLAVCKAVEILVQGGKIVGPWALDLADRVVKWFSGDDGRAAMVKSEREAERASREAKERLLRGMNTIEKDD